MIVGGPMYHHTIREAQLLCEAVYAWRRVLQWLVRQDGRALTLWVAT